MAASKPQDPLQILDQMFNEVLVQTGKHLRATTKDRQNNTPGANSAIRANTSESLTTYQYALDDLESEIIRAKSVILRDLEKLRASRVPIPAPVPAPAPQLMAPPAPMMELPSSAAHTMSSPAFVLKETKTAAPFPDMGMGMGMSMGMGTPMGMNMSTGIVDLASSEKKKPSPRVPSGVIRPPAKSTPPVKSEVKPSPKQTFKPTPKISQPPKVTPVPPPQIPRLQPPQPATIGPGANPQSQPTAPNVHHNRPPQTASAAQAAQTTQGASLNAMSMPANAVEANPNAVGGRNSLGFTDMQFSLAPSNTETTGAPPAPMPEFDLAKFAPQDKSSKVPPNNSKPSNAAASSQNTTGASQPPPKEQGKNDSNLDDLFNLGDSGAGDNMFDLGGGGINDSTFDDMMYFDNNDTDMAQFDEAYFLQE